MEIAHAYQIEEHSRMKTGSRIDSMSDTLLVIKLPDSQVLRIVSRSLFLTMVILTLPCIGSIFRKFSESPNYFLSEADEFVSNFIDVELLDTLLLDLANEGLVKKGDKAFFVCSTMGSVIDNSRYLNANEIDWVFGYDVDEKMLLNDASFDLVLAFGFKDIKFLDRILKVGGVLITQLGDIPSVLQKQSNYKVAYLRRFSSTIIGTRKTSLTTGKFASSAKRNLIELKPGAKKEALNGLEDILLEPPRKPYFGKFKYLPDLLGDSLEDYPRRVFIDVSTSEEKEKVLAWFNQNYPKRNKFFETYSIEMVEEASMETSLDVSNWLMKNVKEDDFIVMKADVEVLEEILRRRSIGLVDEVYLECENQEGRKMKKRAYWECLALYGRLRDNGVAVHQWWG